jgi:hypothetical protein
VVEGTSRYEGIIYRREAVFGYVKAMAKYWKGRRVSRDVMS